MPVVAIGTLVEAALDAGLPRERRLADREHRAHAIAGWLERTHRLLDGLPPMVPRRPARLPDDGTTDVARRAGGPA